MSRIGKLPVEIPAGVTITVDGDAIKVAGPKGNLETKKLSDVTVTIEDNTLTVVRSSKLMVLVLRLLFREQNSCLI